MRLIDADLLIQTLNERDVSYNADIDDVIRKAQTIEREKGRWIEYPEALRYDKALYETSIVCSCCKSVWDILENETQDFDFCPACGADMRGEQDDND